ncbi:hypothetical protein BDI4_1120018 [Burkholderia diffusa]|nr:hypothetical protein BDI4_1120018 [Burkholderia diffusa]
MVAGQSRSSAARGHRDAWRERREVHRVRAAVRHEARACTARIRLHAGHAVRDHAGRAQVVGRVAAGRAACVRPRRRAPDRTDGRGRVRHGDGAGRRWAGRGRHSRRRVCARGGSARGAARPRHGRRRDAAVLRADRVLRRGALAVRAGRDRVGRRGAGARLRGRVRRRAFRAAGADRQLDPPAVPARAVRHPRRRRDVRPDRTVRRPGADDGADDAVGRVGRVTARLVAPIRAIGATASTRVRARAAPSRFATIGHAPGRAERGVGHKSLHFFSIRTQRSSSMGLSITPAWRGRFFQACD